MAERFQFEERRYQTDAVNEALEQFQNGRESVLIESPVGSGKTIMGLMVIKELQKTNPDLKVNWVASRRHILEQTERANLAYFNCQLNYVSVYNSNPPPADMIVLDEAHHEATQSCLAMYEKTGNALTLGLSATPQRTDRMRLSFQHSVQTCTIQNLISQGILSQYHSYKLPYYNAEIAAKIYCQNPEKWGKTLAFFNSIQECVDFSSILNAQGIPCDVVTGSSNRDKQLELFINGELQIIANVSVLSEGFDLPELQSVFLRDASRLPCIQMAGRGLRKSPCKQFCNIVQSENSRYQIEKIATPQESFLYNKEVWLSCSGNTAAIAQALQRSLDLLDKRKPAKMPIYIQMSPHTSYVSLRNRTSKRISYEFQ